MILVSYIQPFDHMQQIFVLDESTKDTVETVPTTIQNYEYAVTRLIDKYGAKLLQMHGPEKYCLKIKRNIEDEQNYKYNRQKLIVEIV